MFRTASIDPDRRVNYLPVRSGWRDEESDCGKLHDYLAVEIVPVMPSVHYQSSVTNKEQKGTRTLLWTFTRSLHTKDDRAGVREC